MNAMRSRVAPIIIAVMFIVLMRVGYAQTVHSPAPGGPSSNGTALDQVIAYFLLLVALAVTYLVH